jgi:hypothetical protein
MRKRLIAVFITGLLTLGLAAGPASADPAFGPGNTGGGEGNSHPQDPADNKCHPPGQTAVEPGCK